MRALEGRLLLIRHAESLWNAEGRWQGQADPGLSARGHDQARGLAARLASLRVEVLLASDLARAAETARIVGAELGLEPRLDVRLREHDVGEWSGLTHGEIARRWPDDLARLRAGDLDVRPGGGETKRELAARVTDAIAELAANHAREHVALVSHSGWIRVLVPGLVLGNAETWRYGDAAPALAREVAEPERV
ncbi:MAG TPA: histidine phosphatase family protein [Myxococcota bacterium]|nr:histidine phosphatase family protein [Myxococcota bacterium]